tara:strand:+ start:64 stop:687 length:624 start_codon:yes stop_codon:yes gene_type:complete
MTEDWRKELGLDNVDYKWQMDKRFKIPDEEFFCHEFLKFLKVAKTYQIKRKLNRNEKEGLSQNDINNYNSLDEEYENLLQDYLRDHPSATANKLQKKLKSLLGFMIKQLNAKKIMNLNVEKISTKYSKIPNKGYLFDIQRHDQWDEDVRFHNYKGKKLSDNSEISQSSSGTKQRSKIILKIEKLKRLYKKGILDKHDFEKSKNKLLK